MRCYISHVKVNRDRNALKRNLALFVKDNGRKEMVSQNLTLVFKNNLMDYTVLVLDRDIEEEKLKIVTR